MVSWQIEEETGGIIIGVDEAGRGPLAGPVVAASIIVPRNLNLPELNDSKKLTAKKRESLYKILIENCQFAISEVCHKQIDEINILQATRKAIKEAVKELQSVTNQDSTALIDGNMTFNNFSYKSIVKGDSLSVSIAAASVIAKVHRDNLMVELDKIYPQYGFAIHKGYGTKVHIEALKKFGPCPIHRASFLKKLLS